jgi:hypothetical protein
MWKGREMKMLNREEHLVLIEKQLEEFMGGFSVTVIDSNKYSQLWWKRVERMQSKSHNKVEK